MRKILIVPFDTVEKHLEFVEENNIDEIIEGIPPSLADEYTNDDLPAIYEEEPSPPTELSPIERLEEKNKLLKAQNNALSERVDFLEDLIAEMAMMIYP